MNANQNRNWPVSPPYQHAVQQAHVQAQPTMAAPRTRPQAHASVAQQPRPQVQPSVAQQARVQAQPTVAQQVRPQAHAANLASEEPASETWHVQVAAGDVRVVDLDKLDDLFRFEVIDENVFVWQKGMQNWVRLGDLLGPSDEETEDPFHVLFGPGNVRVLTLDELNDFYRYEVIDESTLIWQKGMSEWQTLGRAAGIDEAVLPLPASSSSVATQITHRAPGASNVQTNTAAPYGATVAAPVRVSAAAPTARSVAPTAPSARPPASAVSPATQATSPAPAVSSLSNPAGLAALPTQAITRPAPVVQLAPSAPFSTRPVSLSIEPYANVSPPRASRWLVRFAVAAGVILAMLRNDVVHAALGKSSMLAQYEQVERSVFGGPAFGTTRSVEQLVASCGGHLDSVHLPIAVTQFSDAHKRGTAPDTKRSDADASPTRDASASVAGGTPSVASNPTTPNVNTAQSQSGTSSANSGSAKTASDMAKALGAAPPKPASKAAVVSQPMKRRPPAAKAAAKSGVKSGGSYYDPLNGAL